MCSAPSDLSPITSLKSPFAASTAQARLKGTLPGYRSEPNVDTDSTTETFAAVKLYIDNWRWQDVPFYLRTGKRLPERLQESPSSSAPCLTAPFRPTPTFHGNRTDSSSASTPMRESCCTSRQNSPGPNMLLHPVSMVFPTRERSDRNLPEAYETLLLDVMKGDATLFMRADQVEAAWTLVQPVLDAWSGTVPPEFPNYASGTWGPAAADRLLAHDGRAWTEPLAADPDPPPPAPAAPEAR